ncbi:hypothetical protein GCM10020001_002740 [Nonomuraea salmonea]
MMSARTAAATAARIEEHAAAHGLRSVNVVLHGGEPLLCGPAHLRTLLATFAGMSVRAHLTVQTNGLRLGPAFLDLFDEFRVRVGVSMDGGRAAHDRHRRTRAGRGSYDRVRAAVETLAAREGRFAGLLCTIDLRNDPVEVYEELISLRPPAVDFLLPHGNWSQPPPGRVPRGGTPYADWLIAVFDRWYGAVPPETSVRFLEGILVLHLGGRSGTEGIGPEPAAVVVVESDGSIEQSDALKSAYQGGPPRPGCTSPPTPSTPSSACPGWPSAGRLRPPAWPARAYGCAAAGTSRTATATGPASTGPASTAPTCTG